MNVIAFTGLVTIEKIQLIIDLATHYTWQTDQSVAIIDNVARLAIDPAQLSDEPLIRIQGDITTQLTDTLHDMTADTVLIAVSESAEPDNLFVSLDMTAETLSHINLITIGLIDLRTCDCFPNLREKLEDYADMHFLAPFDAEKVIGALEGDIG